MKTEKENAADRADQAEQRQKDFEEKLKAVSATTNLFVFIAWEKHRWSFLSPSFQSEEEGNALQKRIQQIEAELDAAQEQLGEANAKLEAKEKAAADVRLIYYFSSFLSLHSSDDIHHQFSIRIFHPFELSPSLSLSLSLSIFFGYPLSLLSYLSEQSSPIPFSSPSEIVRAYLCLHISIYLCARKNTNTSRRRKTFPREIDSWHTTISVFSWLKARSMRSNSIIFSKIVIHRPLPSRAKAKATVRQRPNHVSKPTNSRLNGRIMSCQIFCITNASNKFVRSSTIMNVYVTIVSMSTTRHFLYHQMIPKCLVRYRLPPLLLPLILRRRRKRHVGQSNPVVKSIKWHLIHRKSLLIWKFPLCKLK